MPYRLLDRLHRRWVRNYGQGLVGLAGFALIATGIVCLYLSDQVVTGWWQGTLDAFGVGFVVGGIVDVLAISALNQRTRNEDLRLQVALQNELNERNRAEDQRLRENNRQAEQILKRLDFEAAKNLLDRAGDRIDSQLRHELRVFTGFYDRKKGPQSPTTPEPPRRPEDL